MIMKIINDENCFDFNNCHKSDMIKSFNQNFFNI